MIFCEQYLVSILLAGSPQQTKSFQNTTSKASWISFRSIHTNSQLTRTLATAHHECEYYCEVFTYQTESIVNVTSTTSSTFGKHVLHQSPHTQTTSATGTGFTTKSANTNYLKVTQHVLPRNLQRNY